MSVDHYENFPVASWLCPAAMRPAVVAIYHFARTADDLADEGDAPADARQAALAEYRQALLAAANGQPDPTRWPQVFRPLADAIRRHQLPLAPMTDLLSAFAQDTGNPVYPDRTALLDYCGRSANPVGRLVLHLAGIADAPALARSDAICTALQLINFWQDVSLDLPRGRCYFPMADLQRHGLSPVGSPSAWPATDTPATRALLADLCGWADGLMRQGAPLVHQVPGRLGWELRLVVQGGLRILEKISRLSYGTWRQRPTLGRADAPLLLWRALAMRA